MWHEAWLASGLGQGAFLALEAGFGFSTLTPPPHILDLSGPGRPALALEPCRAEALSTVLAHHSPEGQVSQNGQPLREPLLTFKC